jgi:tetratricopeptide (TPR) repeat protein
MLFFSRRRPFERIATSFRWLERKPFPAAREPSYESRYEGRSYVLTLRKERVFAWETLDEDSRLTDFILEAEVEPDMSNGHSALGVLFRHVNDENFYSFLVSSRGNFRVDALFNNHPMRIIDWTRLPGADPERSRTSRLLRVIGRGSKFSLYADDEWVAEAEDDMLPEGTVGFAAQNFAGAGPGTFKLLRFLLEARPLVVEREHMRSWHYAPVNPASRLRLAETLYASGGFRPAAVQIRKALKDREGAPREGTPREHFLLAECYMRLSLYDDALAEVGLVLAVEPRHAEARQEKANLLYLAHRLLEARDSLLQGFSDGSIPRSPGALNLLGNAEYGLGNWEKAVDAYREAADQQPEMPLFAQNAARALEQAGRREESVRMYLRAARRLFAEEAFDELSLVVPRVRTLAPDDPEVRALEAKMLYREGKTDEAFAILRHLAEGGSTDSAVHYLLGLILTGRGARAEALSRFSRAAALEPDFPLYQFRLAETLHILGSDLREPLARALGLAPLDPWVNNLEGQIRIEEGDHAGAVSFLSVARDAAPGEETICLNLSEALARSGRGAEALEVIDGYVRAAGERAPTANQRGNVLALMGDKQGAVREYEKAIRLDPENAAYKENCAAACLDLDMVHRAEELLAQVEPDHPSASVYNLLGQVAALKGERARADLAYSAALERDPGNPEISVNLALLHRERGKHDAARDLLLSVLAAHPGHVRARSLLDRLRAEREMNIQCATCGREWWVPRDLPPQPALRVRGEPPAEAPAGRCPTCRKVYCVGCASAHVREMRFFCPDDGEFLKLSEDALKWLLARALEAASRLPDTGSP